MPDLKLEAELTRPDFQCRVNELWGIRFKSVCPSVRIEGSPERSLSRVVFEDMSGRLFLMEKFAGEKYTHRYRVARTLVFLNQNGLDSALTPEITFDGEYLPFIKGSCFHITRYLDSRGIDRPGWLTCSTMGHEMARFLIEMHRAAQSISEGICFTSFSIKNYIYKLFRDMEGCHPQIFKQYHPILEFLETGFMAVHDNLPKGFCHGDFHPLNVIWDKDPQKKNRIKAVIDWEFTGIKPDCYDAANLVGCAGIEHPEGLAMPMVSTFLSTLKNAGIISPVSLKWFPEYVLALRFAWLSEWLRNNDLQMLDTELAYMNILIRHMDELRDIWGLINK